MTYLDSILDHYFWSKVTKSESCWEFSPKFRTNGGYGYVSFANGNIFAHRFAWELANGKAVPSGMSVCHHCDNRAYVNPAHLFIGTKSDNSRDFDRKYSRRSKTNPVGLRTHCSQGHELTPSNTYVHPVKGWRFCRVCKDAYARRHRAKKLVVR